MTRKLSLQLASKMAAAPTHTCWGRCTNPAMSRLEAPPVVLNENNERSLREKVFSVPKIESLSVAEKEVKSLGSMRPSGSTFPVNDPVSIPPAKKGTAAHLILGYTSDGGGWEGRRG